MNEHTEVLVVGAGPAGLTTAIGLARAGIDVLVVERHAGTSPFPKSTVVSTRTMELLRTWGLDHRVRAGGMRVRAAITASRTLVEPERASAPTAFPTDEAALAVSPATPCLCAQDHLEPILLEHLVSRGGQVDFGTELTALRTDAVGVTAELLDRQSGRRWRARARYVVGADGPRSTVRNALGLDVEELGTLGDWVAVTFRAELTRRMTRTPSAINAVEVDGGAGLFVPTSTDDRWIYAHPSTSTPRDYPEVLRLASGMPELQPQIITVMPFTMAASVAAALRSRCGRGFLVGDAAHRTTPMGGVGMNTAMHAAHNLSWKLAWVLRGHAGDPLLDSYQDERLPVGRRNALRSLRDGGYDGLAMDVGVSYASTVVDADAGQRAPHAWLRHAGRRVSTLDEFDGRLTVLTGASGGRWRAATRILAATGVPIAARTVGRDLHPVDGTFADRYQLGSVGAVLVRPDGFVAWRHDGPVRDATTVLRAAVEKALGRSSAALTHAS